MHLLARPTCAVKGACKGFIEAKRRPFTVQGRLAEVPVNYDVLTRIPMGGNVVNHEEHDQDLTLPDTEANPRSRSTSDENASH